LKITKKPDGFVQDGRLFRSAPGKNYKPRSPPDPSFKLRVKKGSRTSFLK
jgi:hypothetical protein